MTDMTTGAVKLNAKNAHKIDLHTLGEDDLRKLCASLIASRQAQEETNAHQKIMIKKQAKISQQLLPEAATMIEALAERAGLSGETSVRAMAEALGEQTYVQWSQAVRQVVSLPEDAAIRHDREAGDAEMVLGAELGARILEVSRHLEMGRINGQAAEAVRALIAGIDEKLMEAVRNGFKARGEELVKNAEALASLDATRSAADVAGQPVRAEIGDISHALCDLMGDLDIGRAMLRLDLRAGMYRDLIVRLGQITSAANELRRT